MKTIEKHIMLVGENTYVAAKVATYLHQEFGFVLDELIPNDELNDKPNVISIHIRVENISYISRQDFIFYLDGRDLSNTTQVAHSVMSEACNFFLREFHNKEFLSQ